MSDPMSIWKAPPLSTEDQRLIDAYVHAGRSVDELPYTPEFEQIARSLNVDLDDQRAMHLLFKRLVTLRKQARLPRIAEFASHG
jgi:hypothetical protein